MRKVNKKALLEYFTFQNIFTDQTLLEDISILPAGYYGILNYDKGKKILNCKNIIIGIINFLILKIVLIEMNTQKN